MIKRVAAEESHSCHKKQKEAVTLRPFWRCTFSVNEEPENLLVLPPLDESVQDKLMVFKVKRAALFDTDKWNNDKVKDMAALQTEIPGFLGFLKKFEIPEKLRSGRFGVVAYQHPDIKVALDCMSPQERMLELIDEACFPEDTAVERAPFSGRASAIECKLMGLDSPVKEAARGLLTWPQAASTYLTRLEAREGGRVKSKTARGGYKVFTISPPGNPGKPANKSTIDPEGWLRKQPEDKDV